ncbi:hypothetical protein A3D85_00590 [Candidatus Amesbacteria bacterium RIFCSPHIGHO2_02_FULL_47_9]|uniref:DDH domain-containing protein n=1 Tax=Candidatus Amesbacteria bacterium RIFCSPHIGHO2_01_FULL_48_32b TaxID=1797253 RepID=A0A1F4YFX7_9BACT|nr:MAG: hypothetical protein A2876_03835 [Candidatus Amesbacteria bacterium RIFCSPHIGHO2_01_FULL_48_32b]OGD03017.1 MAG: hypothetical protein A3D85_00590 [Candidatus Amesbacteria bacterium RIFCSPHIGHO2_02_FULL_47_9]
MSDQVAKLAPVIWSEIQKAKHILLHCHPNPDLDSVGSVLALKHILKKIGTSAQVISGDDPIPANTRFLPGVDQIMKSGFTEIDPKDYDLFIICDSSDPKQITQKTDLKLPLQIRSIVIDHHNTNVGYGDINLVIPDQSSTCEIIYNLVCRKDKQLVDLDAAQCLYAGIWSDTGGFSFAKSGDTFRTIADLIDKGVDNQLAINELSSSSTKYLKFVGYGLYESAEHFGGQVLISKLSLKKQQEIGLSPEKYFLFTKR